MAKGLWDSAAIKALRLASGLTQKEFGELIGASKTAVSGWEVGRASPQLYLEMRLDAIQKAVDDRKFADWVAVSSIDNGVVKTGAFRSRVDPSDHLYIVLQIGQQVTHDLFVSNGEAIVRRDVLKRAV